MMENLEDISNLASLFNREEPVLLFIGEKEMEALNEVLSSNNHFYDNAGDYGKFDNSKNKAVELGFKTIYIDGVTLHFNTIENYVELVKKAKS